MVGNCTNTAPGSPGYGFIYTYSTGNLITFNYPQTTVTGARGINDNGQIVGYYVDANGTHGFLYNYGGDGSWVSFDYPGVGVLRTYLAGINGQGQIVGFYQDTSGNEHGFIWNHASDGSLVPINYPSQSYTETDGINGNGLVIGWYYNGFNADFPFLYSNGSFSTFPDDPNDCGAGCTLGRGINNYDRVAGQWLPVGGGEWKGFWAVPPH